MPRYQINVSAPVLMRNRRHGRNDRPVIVRRCKGDVGPQPYTMCHSVRILGPSTLIHEAFSVRLETDAEIEMVDPLPGLDQ
jgi:hypothetical protein